MKILVYIDGATVPTVELDQSSEAFDLDTTGLTDGAHVLRLETVEDGKVTGRREIPFTVRNGPGIAVGGLRPGDEVHGRIRMVANASAARIDSRMDVHAMETHRGLPLFMGVIGVVVILLGGLYIATDPLRHRAYDAVAAELMAEAERVAGPPATASRVGSASAAPLAAALKDPSLEPAVMQISLAARPALPILSYDAAEADTAAGASLYAARCSGCHGAEGGGSVTESVTLGADGIFPRLAGQPAAYLYRQLVSFERGLRASHAMAPMAKSLSDAEMRDVAAAIATFSAPYAPSTPTTADVLAVGRMLAVFGQPARGIGACEACHGPDGAGVPPNFPALFGQNADYIERQLVAFASGTRTDAILHLMQPVATVMTEPERRAVGRYFAQLPDGMD